MTLSGRRIALVWLSTLFLHGTIGTALAQSDPKTAMLERAGFDALDRGDARSAAIAFHEALTSDPKNPRLHLGAGMAALLEMRDREALDALSRALALAPGLTRARALLGRAQYRLGEVAAAIRTYEALVMETPGDADARATLERWRREMALHGRMQETIGSHFTVSFEGPAESALADQALEALDRAFWRVGQLLDAYPIKPVPVVLYSSEQFRDITRSPAWAAAAYDGIIRVPVRGALDNPKEVDRVLAHEYVHALVQSLAPRGVPVWLNEGLAAALESDDLGWATARVAGRTPVNLRALESGFNRLSGPQAQVAYATSALAVRRLLDEAGGVAVANLLRDLGAGVPFEGAFLRRIQRAFADFQLGY